ncbi:AMP-dependent synthetase [Nocardioides sp. Root1257]|nr:AMP-dependent synthetase [Nocardioides sp. Root1257]KRC39963.1 AMP-dependent synthetase [Nocardioides sp. Root224]
MIDGVAFRMYAQRPHRVSEILTLADRWGSRVHLIQGDRKVTFAELTTSVENKAKYLTARGIGRGHRVLLLGWNSPDWIVNFWACTLVGAVPALANAWWSAGEVSDAISLLDPAIVLADVSGTRKLPAEAITGEWAAAGVEDSDDSALGRDLVSTVSENDPAVIIFTSGTGGAPKAVELSNRSLVANLQMLLNMTHRLPHEVTDDAGEVVLHTGPLFHVGGPQMLMRSVAVGNTIVLPAGRFDPAEALDLIELHQISRWAAVPTMVTRLLDHPDIPTRDVGSLRSVTIGGAPVHPELLDQISRTLPAVRTGVPTGYGLTENCGQATAASGRETVKHPGTAGRPLPLAELKFVPVEGMPDAEILVRSPTQMTRYVGTDESPIDDEGWLHTGDLGRLDDGGRLWITGRSKDLIIRGGENIAPAAVERALTGIPGVTEAAVVGVPHADLGEEVFAFVVISDLTLTAENLRARLSGSLASFAVPTHWSVSQDPLPTNHTGKVDKPALARRAADR